METEAPQRGWSGLHNPQLPLPRRAARNAVSRMSEVRSKYELFDRSRLSVKPLSERSHDLPLDRWLTLDDLTPEYSHPQLTEVARRMVAAGRSGAARILMMGAHVLRAGVNRHIIDLLERRALSHIAMNGAGAIHDYELARIGA